MKVLLVYPSCFYAPKWGKKDILKVHMLHIFPFLKRNGIEVEVLDLENEIGRPGNESDRASFKEKSAALISRYDFQIAAISCWSSLDYLSSRAIAEICKNVNSSCIVVVGGYHPSAVPSDFVYQGSVFDFTVTGEGETALLDICTEKYKRKNSPDIIRGTALDLSRKAGLLWKKYPYIKKRSINNIYLSRGCPYSCSYCMEQSKGYAGWRNYSVNDSISCIETLVDALHPKQIFIRDACFGLKSRWRKQFLTELCRIQLGKIIWAETRIELFDKEDLDLLEKLNFVTAFGIESFSETMLAIMNKPGNPKHYIRKCEETLSYMNKRHIPYIVILMFNHPGETYESFHETLNFFQSFVHRENQMSGYISAANYVFFPGSSTHRNIYEYEKKYGTVVQHKEWWKEEGDHYEMASSVIASRSLSDTFREERNYWKKDIFELNQLIFEKMPMKTKVLWHAKFENEKDIEL